MKKRKVRIAVVLLSLFALLVVLGRHQLRSLYYTMAPGTRALPADLIRPFFGVVISLDPPAVMNTPQAIYTRWPRQTRLFVKFQTDPCGVDHLLKTFGGPDVDTQRFGGPDAGQIDLGGRAGALPQLHLHDLFHTGGGIGGAREAKAIMRLLDEDPVTGWFLEGMAGPRHPGAWLSHYQLFIDDRTRTTYIYAWVD